MTGRMVLVVGPSGAGKDTIMAAARDRLSAEARVLFARRVITRPAEAGGEDYDSVTPEAFDAIEAQGGFALSWRAHGLAYGIPASVRLHLEAGGIAVANGSRAMLDEARRRFPGLIVVLVTASPEVLAERLAARGRETRAEIEKRLARGGEFEVEGPDVRIVRNDTTLEASVTRFLDILATAGAAC